MGGLLGLILSSIPQFSDRLYLFTYWYYAISDGERLRNMLNLVQILLMIGIYVMDSYLIYYRWGMSSVNLSLAPEFSWYTL